MSFANGTIGEIIKALDMSGVEMLAISLPDARIVDATQCLVRRWQCGKYDMIGRQLSQSPKDAFHARYVDADLTGLGTHTASRIELTYKPEGALPQTLRFKPQLFRDGEREFLLLIGPPSHAAGIARVREAEARLELAVKAGGYGAWDYDFRTRLGDTAPEIHAMLGLAADNSDTSFLDLDGRAHPEDASRTASARLRELTDACGSIQARYRLRHEQGNHVWVEVMASLIKDPISGQPAKIVGLARDITAETEALQRIETSERNLARSQAVARMGSWVLDLTTGQVQWSDQMATLFGLDRQQQPSFDILHELIEPASRRRWEEALSTAANGQPVIGFECDFRTAAGEMRRINTHIDPEFGGDGGILRLHGICHDTTEQIHIERKALQTQQLEAVGQLAAGIAHDFSDLLTAAIGNLQLAEREQGMEDVRKRVRLALEALARGGELITRLMEVTGDEPLEPGPDAEAVGAEPQAPEPPQHDPQPPAPPVVLIVEDNDAVREVAVAMVEEMGYPVLGASTGPEALRIIAERQDIALLLSDVVMVGMTGPELAFQALASRPGLKVLFASGYAGDTLEEVQEMPQVVDLINKPFTREELTEKVRRALAPPIAA